VPLTAPLRTLIAAVLAAACVSCGGSSHDTVASRDASAVAASPAAAVAVVPARRGQVVSIDTDCDLVTVAALAARHPEVGQWVVARSTGWGATSARLDVAARSASGEWSCQRGDQEVRLGRSGTRPLLQRRSGDGTTPAGVFPLGSTTAWDGQALSFFGNQPDPGVRGTYRTVRLEDCWGASPGTSRYNHLVNRPACASPDEWLARYGDVYAHAAVIGANTEPFVSGDSPGEAPYAAAIFLHRHSYAADGSTRATSGCVSMELSELVLTLRLMDPATGVHFAIGPTDWLRATP
jgi:L,D-peptidoglycan transpeptidase YkuD (ErfK/YbiS/YcfS/YnhG family)